MLVREFLQSPMANPIFDDLRKFQHQAQIAALRHVRDNTTSYDDIRYLVGIADGLGRAISLLENLKKET